MILLLELLPNKYVPLYLEGVILCDVDIGHYYHIAIRFNYGNINFEAEIRKMTSDCGLFYNDNNIFIALLKLEL